MPAATTVVGRDHDRAVAAPAWRAHTYGPTPVRRGALARGHSWFWIDGRTDGRTDGRERRADARPPGSAAPRAPGTPLARTGRRARTGWWHPRRVTSTPAYAVIQVGGREHLTFSQLGESRVSAIGALWQRTPVFRLNPRDSCIGHAEHLRSGILAWAASIRMGHTRGAKPHIVHIIAWQ